MIRDGLGNVAAEFGVERRALILVEFDVVALADGVGQSLHVLGRNLLELIDVATVQERRTTALRGVGQGALHTVALVDLHEIMTDLRSLILDQTGGIDGHASLSLAEAELRAALEPRGAWRRRAT